MNGFQRVLRTALFELSSAIRSRRAVVTMLLFALIGGAIMYATIGMFSLMEEQVVSALGLPAADNSGGVTMTLWRSQGFKNVIIGTVGSSMFIDELVSQHPVLLAFAIVIFQLVPILTLITIAPTAAGEIHSGAVRYVLIRTSRTEWTLGLFLAESSVLLVAMALLAVAGGAVAVFRMPGWTALSLVPAIFSWSLRAWLYSLAWTGVFMGVSLCVKSAGKATGLAILMMIVLIVLGYVASKYGIALDYLRPQCYEYMLWRSSFPAFLEGFVGTVSVTFLYLGLGSAVFARRDV